MNSSIRYLFIGLFGVSLGVGAGFLIARQTNAAADIDASAMPPELRINPTDEPEEYLEAIIALEALHPAYDRSPGYLIARRADRYIVASRLLTDRRLVDAGSLTQDRLRKLRAAVDRFADDLAEAASSHVPTANGPHREVRAALSCLETTLRALALDEAEPLALGGSPDAAYLVGLEARIDSAPCEIPETLLRSDEAEASARESKNRLKAALPALRHALQGLPEAEARALETEMGSWVEDFLPVSS